MREHPVGKNIVCVNAQRTPTKSFALFILDLFVFVIYFVDFGLYFFFLFTFSAYKKKEKVPKRKKNQRSHLEFARILVYKFLGTRPQKFASKIQQF